MIESIIPGNTCISIKSSVYEFIISYGFENRNTIYVYTKYECIIK